MPKAWWFRLITVTLVLRSMLHAQWPVKACHFPSRIWVLGVILFLVYHHEDMDEFQLPGGSLPPLETELGSLQNKHAGEITIKYSECDYLMWWHTLQSIKLRRIFWKYFISIPKLVCPASSRSPHAVCPVLSSLLSLPYTFLLSQWLSHWGFVNISFLLSWRSSKSHHLTFLKSATALWGSNFAKTYSLIYFSKYHRDAFMSMLPGTLHSQGYETNQHPATQRWTECGPQALESHRVTMEN